MISYYEFIILILLLPPLFTLQLEMQGLGENHIVVRLQNVLFPTTVAPAAAGLVNFNTTIREIHIILHALPLRSDL